MLVSAHEQSMYPHGYDGPSATDPQWYFSALTEAVVTKTGYTCYIARIEHHGTKFMDAI